MTDLVDMTPKERVFGTLKNLATLFREAPCLNSEREQLIRSIDNAISWESEVVDLPNDLHNRQAGAAGGLWHSPQTSAAEDCPS